jgi:uncharacterized repeat protein (TIGR01451 family)
MKCLHKLGIVSLLMAAVLVLAASNQAMALGTVSGTPIDNSATVDYQVSGLPQAQIPSNIVTFLVDNKVDLTVARVSDATVIPGTNDQVLAYSITNTGNTTQGYSVAYTGGVDDFDMNNVRIYLDTNNDGLFDGGDTLYTLGTRIADVLDDDSIQVLIVSDTPLGVNDAETAVYNLIATTLDAGTTTVTVESAGPEDPATVQVVFADGAGTDDAVQDGEHSADAVYTVSSAALTVVKSSEVIADGLGNVAPDALAVPGATVRYTVVVSNTGSIDATTVVVVDDIPVNTTYLPGTITLDGGGLTDINGDDDGDFGATNPNAVTVTIPLLAVANSATITFDVTID